MRASIVAAALLIASLTLVSTGCRRPLVLDQQSGLDHEVLRENDAVPEVGPAAQVGTAPERVVLNAPEPVRAERAIDPAGPIATVTAANPGLSDIDLRYNPATEITIRDVVLGKRYVRLNEHHTGVIVELQPGGDFIDVLAGTTKYLFQADVDLQMTDPLMVTGSRIVVNGRPLLLAKTLYLRNREILLRDEDNYPLWRDADQKPDRDGD